MQVEGHEFAVKHQLMRVEMKLILVSRTNQVAVEAKGFAHTKRGPLWSVNEAFDPKDQYGPADHLNHIVLVALQDQPRNEADLNTALRGGRGWEDQELPF